MSTREDAILAALQAKTSCCDPPCALNVETAAMVAEAAVRDWQAARLTRIWEGIGDAVNGDIQDDAYAAVDEISTGVVEDSGPQEHK